MYIYIYKHIVLVYLQEYKYGIYIYNIYMNNK